MQEEWEEGGGVGRRGREEEEEGEKGRRERSSPRLHLEGLGTNLAIWKSDQGIRKTREEMGQA